LKRLVAHLEEKLAQLLQEHDNSTSLNKLETSIVQKKADEALERNLSLEAQIESMREEVIVSLLCLFTTKSAQKARFKHQKAWQLTLGGRCQCTWQLRMVTRG